MKVEIRSRYAFDTTKCKGLECTFEEGKTQSQFKDECDINYLLRHYNNVPKPEPVYGDCTQYSDLQSAMNVLNAAENDFMALPSDIRSRFNHSPIEFYNFCNNAENYDELVNLGLANKKLEQVPLDVTVPTDTNLQKNDSEVSSK